jgi:uncharacterized protein YqfA (UPF0365 family)
MSRPPTFLITVLAIAGFIVLGVLFVIAKHLGLYIQCAMANAHVSIFELIGMNLRRVDVREICITHIRLRKEGLDVPLAALETHWMAGGHPAQVATAMIAAHRGRKHFTWDEAASLDLKGQDVVAVCEERFGVSRSGGH